MASDLRSRILGSNDIKIEKIAIPEWGGDYCVKIISGTDRDAFEETYAEQKMKAFRVRFLVLCLCDEKGDRIFKDEDAAELGKKSSVVINRVFESSTPLRRRPWKPWEKNDDRQARAEVLPPSGLVPRHVGQKVVARGR